MKLQTLAVLVGLPLVLVGCGGSSSSGGGGGVPAPGSTINSVFIDAPVKGIKVIPTSEEGKSTADSATITSGAGGVFQCKEGESLGFYVGDLRIGSAVCASKIYLYDLSELSLGAVYTLSGVDHLEVATLIQSLSKFNGSILDLTDFNATEISLSSFYRGDIDADIEKLFEDNSEDLEGAGLEPVSLVEATAHVQKFMPKLNDEFLAFAAGQKPTAIDLVGAASNPDDCYEKAQFKGQVVRVDKSAFADNEGIYRFDVVEYVTYDGPEAPNCNSKAEYDYACYSNLASRVMTGRSVNGSRFDSKTVTLKEGTMVGCKKGEEVRWEIDIMCEEGETALTMKDDQEGTLTNSWSFSGTISETKSTVNVKEVIVQPKPIINEDNTVTIQGTQTLTCNYSGSVEYEAPTK